MINKIFYIIIGLWLGLILNGSAHVGPIYPPHTDGTITLAETAVVRVYVAGNELVVQSKVIDPVKLRFDGPIGSPSSGAISGNIGGREVALLQFKADDRNDRRYDALPSGMIVMHLQDGRLPENEDGDRMVRVDQWRVDDHRVTARGDGR